MTKRKATLTLAAAALAAATASSSAAAPVRVNGSPQVRTVAGGLVSPWEIAFLPDGSALITERPGRVRFMTRQRRLSRRVAGRLRVGGGEGGLLGLAVDPAFGRNRYVYLFRTVGGTAQLLRYRFAGGRLRSRRTLVRRIGANAIHDAGRVHFGPGGRLYFTTGDKAAPGLSQDSRSLNGKFLSLSPRQYRGRGGRPRVISKGHRNPQGFDWQPGTGRLIATEHGPDGDDEVNHIRRGGNYGWPLLRGREKRSGFTSPLAVYGNAIAPSGGSFASQRGSRWTGDFLFGALRGQQIRKLSFSRGGRVTRNQALFRGSFGRVRTVVEAPDGSLYALTSNRDGRGSPQSGDDRVIRIIPPRG